MDGFPVNKDQWSLFLEHGKNLPDQVIFLQDESPNGDMLIERWYAANKEDVDDDTERYHIQLLSLVGRDFWDCFYCSWK